MEEEPDLSPKEATKKAMRADHRAGHRDHAGAAVGVRAGRLSFPALSGTLFRQFAVTISVAMLISAINALTLSPALCARVPAPHGERRAAPMGWVLRGIDKVRDGYAAVGAPAAARGGALACWLIAAVGVGICRLARHHADRLPARGGPGRVLHRRAVARRRVGGAHARGGGAGRGADPADAAGRGGAVDRRLLAARRRRQSNAAFLVVTPEAVRRPHGGGRRRAGGDRADVRRGAADPLGHRLPVQPAADHRPVDQRRLRIPVENLEGPRPGRDGAA